VHEATGTAVGWLAEIDARRRTEHLAGDPGKRRYAMTTLIDLAQRPALPDITDAMILDGSWAAALTEMSEQVDAALSDLLARSLPPNADALRGQPSRSERLDRLLRETIDRAAMDLERRLDRDDKRQPVATTSPDPRAELAAMGVEV
jgi:hypothetical protein